MADEKRGFTITRVFDAPRERVWREWTDPEAFADWFGGPQSEVPVDSVELDVRPGGAWRATMYAGPDRREINWHGEYVEVVEPERLVMTMSDVPEPATSDPLVVELTDLGDGRTEMRLEQPGWLPPEQAEAAKRGWGGFFDRMDERLAEAP